MINKKLMLDFRRYFASAKSVIKPPPTVLPLSRSNVDLDTISIKVQAGNGGPGHVHFAREP